MSCKKILSAILCGLLTVSLLPVTSPFAADGGDSATAPYYDDFCRGIVDHFQTGVCEMPVNFDGKKTVKVTPDPEGADAAKKPITLDAYGIEGKGFDLDKYGYIVIEYYYDAPDPTYTGRMSINLLPSRIGLSGAVAFHSNEDLVPGSWQKATFNIRSGVQGRLVDGSHVLWQFHLYPFGNKTASTLTEKDVLYIGDITFTANNPNPDRKYTVSFTGGGAKEGEAPAELSLTEGSVFKLPECTFLLGNAEFQGWTPSNDANALYRPGAELKMGDQDMMFIAKWGMKQTGRTDALVLSYPSYYCGIIDKTKRFTDISLEDSAVTMDGLDAIMAKPNPNAETGVYFGFDGYTFSGAGIDTTVYNYAAILYRFDTAREHKDMHTQLRFLSGGYTKSFYLTGEEPLKFDRWDIITYDMTTVSDLVDKNNPIVKHIHILPFEEGKIRELDAGDAFYISKLMFFKEKPEHVEAHTAYMSGYEDGTFRPNDTMTRAEACTVVARLSAAGAELSEARTSAFSDVPSDAWFAPYVTYLESKGLLGAYSGAFLPNRPITRAEFVELVYLLGLLKDSGKNGVFTDVAADHPRYTVITAAGKAGLVNGYDNGDGTFSFKPDDTITRAEVVTVINNAYGRSSYKNEYIEKFDIAPLFPDVTEAHWAFLNIMEAAIPHGTYESNEDGKEIWFYMSTTIPVDTASGEAKLAEVEALAAKRKAEILAAPDALTVTGTKYYVSNTGDDSHDGTSPATAWATLEKVSKTRLASGDGVFFERGGTFRGELKTAAGVSYGAYGEGAKPILTRSVENGAGEGKWSLVPGTQNIWKFKTEMFDIGGLVVDKGEGEFIVERVAPVFDKQSGTFRKNANTEDVFDVRTDLTNDLTIFSDVRSTEVTTEKGSLYLRCDEGDPGKVFRSIEFITNGGHVVAATSRVTIDNLCIKYGARHGIGAGTVNDLAVTNCEIGWIGGGIMHYNVSNGLYAPTLYGNGVEVYGGCDNYRIDNCYVYQCYDAGITNQYQKGGSNDVVEKDVTFSNNLIECCCYNIEYFMGVGDTPCTRLLQNVVYENNILRMAGYGWGRGPAPGNAADIKGWDHYNMADGFVIRNNIFDRSRGDLLHIGVQQFGWFPTFEGNIYLQHVGRKLGHLGQNTTSLMKYDAAVGGTVADLLGDMAGGVYFLKAE